MPIRTTKRDANRRHFDRWAVRYESDRVSRRLAGLQQAALAELALEAGDRLLDVGCGTGPPSAPRPRSRSVRSASTSRPR